MQRIVGRAELRSEGTSPSSSPDPGAVEELRTMTEFNITDPIGNTQNAEDSQGLEPQDEEIDFRLFAFPTQAVTAGDTGKTNRIRLRSPSIDNTRAGFVKPGRASSYYFSGALSVPDQKCLEEAAVTGDQVLMLSRLPRPGCSYSWKVLHLPAASQDKTMRQSHPSGFSALVDGAVSTKRKRAGKKYRIKLRIKHRQLQAQQEARKAEAEAKDIAEREKRTRRNREKKVKKRLRDKAKKGGPEADKPSDSELDVGD
ncbi:hypothetical protein LTR37_018040 [Vermiconidia calcicola]|uniref:Uncharacterized protein n=1 Tax=Vermiconidia calcicola TaxID=1690605 RepID=A0ACC3MJI3_9PEZI|nr:hypothetical protein LTR37_018040 [Vermiconidia calcicola]